MHKQTKHEGEEEDIYAWKRNNKTKYGKLTKYVCMFVCV